MSKNTCRERFVHIAGNMVLCGILFFFMYSLVYGSPMVEIPHVDLPNGVPNAGNDSFVTFILENIYPFAKGLLSAVAVFYIVYYGSRVVLAAGNDEAVKKHRLALVYTIFGFLIMNIGDAFNWVFNPHSTGSSGPSVDNWKQVINVIITGIRMLTGAVAVAWLIFSGFRMVTASGNEETITKQKKQIMWSVFGLILVAMAGAFQSVVYEAKTDVSILTSIINMILLFTVPVGVMFLIIGAMYMIMAAGNDAMLKKGQKILQYTVISMIIIYASYTVVSELVKHISI